MKRFLETLLLIIFCFALNVVIMPKLAYATNSTTQQLKPLDGRSVCQRVNSDNETECTQRIQDCNSTNANQLDLNICGAGVIQALLDRQNAAASTSNAQFRLPASARVNLPSPDHVVVVMEENTSFGSIVGSSDAPYINSLASQGANMMSTFGDTHPSQPNYLDLFAGSDLGHKENDCPLSFHGVPNLASELIAAGYSFASYSENLPRNVLTCDDGLYTTYINVAPYFDNVPLNTNLSFDNFPTDFRALPKISFVIPNQNNDMHSNSVKVADTWLKENLDDYAQWAKTHNSLLIIHWDEDEITPTNHIPLIFYGPMLVPGSYKEFNNHLNLLRTLEDMYDLPYVGESDSVAPIADIWTTSNREEAGKADETINVGAKPKVFIKAFINGIEGDNTNANPANPDISLPSSTTHIGVGAVAYSAAEEEDEVDLDTDCIGETAHLRLIRLEDDTIVYDENLANCYSDTATLNGRSGTYELIASIDLNSSSPYELATNEAAHAYLKIGNIQAVPFSTPSESSQPSVSEEPTASEEPSSSPEPQPQSSESTKVEEGVEETPLVIDEGSQTEQPSSTEQPDYVTSLEIEGPNGRVNATDQDSLTLNGFEQGGYASVFITYASGKVRQLTYYFEKPQLTPTPEEQPAPTEQPAQEPVQENPTAPVKPTDTGNPPDTSGQYSACGSYQITNPGYDYCNDPANNGGQATGGIYACDIYNNEHPNPDGSIYHDGCYTQ